MLLAIHLYPHNQKAFDNLKAALRFSPRAAVIQPTGTGKSFIALAMMEEYKESRFLYLSPSNHIFTQLYRHAEDPEVLERTQTLTYQKLCFAEDAFMDGIQADYIILDEFHRCGAQEWGQGVQRLLKHCDGARVVGFTATPIRYLDQSGVRDMAEELFGNCVASYYSLRHSMDDGILPVPLYVLGDIQMREKLEARESAMSSFPLSAKEQEEAYRLLQEMRRNMAQAVGVDQIFHDNLPNHAAKLIVFCRSLDHIEQARTDMRRWLQGFPPPREYVCRSDDGEADRELEAFIQDNAPDALRLLFSVNIVNEGIHIEDLDGIVMLRPTASPTVYLQQIGRCLASAGGSKAQPVIFDLVNNYESARIEDSDQRVFHAEFTQGTAKPRRDREAIPFTITGSVAQFQAVLDKFDHLFTNRSRWEFFYALLRDYLNEYGRYPLHRDSHCGINLGFWVTRQFNALSAGILPSNRAAALRQLPGWDDYVTNRRPGGFHELAAMRQWWKSYLRIREHLDTHGGAYPKMDDSSAQYAWVRRNARNYMNGTLPESQRKALEQLPNWQTYSASSTNGKRHHYNHEIAIQRAAALLQDYTASHAGANPPQYYCTEDGYKLGRKVDRLRQKKRKGLLLPEDIRLLENAGIIWQMREKNPPKSFDAYYEQLRIYREREGHILVPQAYVVPGTDCKLGVFIQRMRMAFKQKGGYRITPEQISRLDALGMVWDASPKKQSKENYYESNCTPAP